MNQLTKVETCRVFIDKLEGHFTELTSSIESSLQFKQEALFALQAIQKNDYTMQVAMNNPASLRNAVLNVASIGLTLNPVERKAYLVPRDGAICLDISYIGMASVAVETGAIQWVQAEIVKEKDTFDYKGVDQKPLHNFKPFEDRGKIIGTYCVVKTNAGDFLTDMMSTFECYEIRNRSKAWTKSGKGPWLTDETEMMKKTVIKRASKLWPKNKQTIRLDNAIAITNEHEGIDFDEENKIEDADVVIEKSKQKEKVNYEEKSQLIETIKELCAIVTEGKPIQEKGKFLNEVLGLKKSFAELNTKTLEHVSEVYKKVMEYQRDLECQ